MDSLKPVKKIVLEIFCKEISRGRSSEPFSIITFCKMKGSSVTFLLFMEQFLFIYKLDELLFFPYNNQR